MTSPSRKQPKDWYTGPVLLPAACLPIEHDTRVVHTKQEGPVLVWSGPLGETWEYVNHWWD